MEGEKKYMYDGKFEGNILAVSQTSFGKTTFIQKIAINNIFGRLLRLEQIPQIELSETQEAEIKSCFVATVKFHYPSNDVELSKMLCFLKKSLNSDINSNSKEQTQGNIFE